MPRKPKVRREDLKPGECLCDHCTGKCCRYFSLPIKTPQGWDDYDEFRWYLAHDKTLIYVHKGTWYLLVKTKCKYLTPRNTCGIYLTRPEVCRDYTTADCEYDEDWAFELCFEAPEQIMEYAEAILPRRKRPKFLGPLVTIGGGNGRAPDPDH